MPITTPVTAEDLQQLTDAEVESLNDLLFADQQRRYRMAQAPVRMDQALKDYQDAAGITKPDGAEWSQPTGALDAYPLGSRVTYQGHEFESLIPANVWAPGDPADPQASRWWKDLTAAAEHSSSTGESTGDGDSAPIADLWDGASHTYEVGDLVQYLGVTYAVIQAHTSQAAWTPDSVPSLYQKTSAS